MSRKTNRLRNRLLIESSRRDWNKESLSIVQDRLSVALADARKHAAGSIFVEPSYGRGFDTWTMTVTFSMDEMRYAFGFRSKSGFVRVHEFADHIARQVSEKARALLIDKLGKQAAFQA